MKIRHRYLPFHTRLEPATGIRDTRLNASKNAEGKVFANDLIVDVGGRCRGYKGETLWVIDHHFHRDEGNFPSAAAAVLHHAASLVADFQGQDEVWIATHREPDFDAFCAAYLARSLLRGELPADPQGWKALGLHPEGWLDFDPPAGQKKGQPRIDWYSPRIPWADPRRWAVLLAAYASCVDQGKPIRCERSRSLHAILYAAAVRGRDLQEDGAVHFFGLARAAIEKHGLNPLIDALFDPEGPFAPELDLLSYEGGRYARDLGRARRAVVSIPVSKKPFHEWFDPLSDQAPGLVPPAYLGEPGNGLRVNPDHLEMVPQEEHRIVDGIYLRDPESLLFKEWARQDREHSPLAQGFTFTAIAYSSRKTQATRGNATDYYFSLDPERADGAHLYPFWLEIQREELEARRAAGQTGPDPEGPRENFTARAGDLAGWLHDPWFDGHNYLATIVPTPNDGTALASGKAADLLDDPAALVAMRMLEYGVFKGTSNEGKPEARVVDFSCGPSGGAIAGTHVLVEDAVEATLCSGCLRFVSAELRPGINLEAPGTAEQIGRLLWPFLEPEGVRGVPSDFREHHLCIHPRHIIVWNRRGAAIAGFGTEEGKLAAEALCVDLRELAIVTGEIRRLVNHHARRGYHARELIVEGQKLLRSLADLRLSAAVPEKRSFREILKRSGLDDSVSVVHALNVRAAEEEEGKRDRELQRTLNGAFFLLGIPSLILGALSVLGKDAFFDLSDLPVVRMFTARILEFEWTSRWLLEFLSFIDSMIPSESACWAVIVASAAISSIALGAFLWWRWSVWLEEKAISETGIPEDAEDELPHRPLCAEKCATTLVASLRSDESNA